MAQADAERGDRIKWLREEKLHLTQEAMSDRVGITLRGYQEWEAGGGIKWDNAKKLAKVGGVSPDWIMSGNKGATPDLSKGPSQLDRIEQSLVALRADLATTQDAVAVLDARLTKELRAIARKLDISAKASRKQTGG